MRWNVWAKVSMVTFDKTGTLTYGAPRVTAVESVSVYSEDDIFALTAAAEQFSEHPLGKAIVKCYGGKPKAAKEFQMIPGEGVTALVDGKQIKQAIGSWFPKMKNGAYLTLRLRERKNI